MSEFFASGRAVDVVLAVVVVEVLVLARFRRHVGIAPRDWIGQVLAGVFLVLAVRSALTGADWRWTASLLLASLPAHLYDMGRRIRAARK